MASFIRFQKYFTRYRHHSQALRGNDNSVNWKMKDAHKIV